MQACALDVSDLDAVSGMLDKVIHLTFWSIRLAWHVMALRRKHVQTILAIMM